MVAPLWQQGISLMGKSRANIASRWINNTKWNDTCGLSKSVALGWIKSISRIIMRFIYKGGGSS